MSSTDTKTFIIGGAISDGVYVRPLDIEGGAIVGFRARSRAGSAVVRWYVNGAEVYAGQCADSDPATGHVDLAAGEHIAVGRGNAIRPEIYQTGNDGSLCDIAVTAVLAATPALPSTSL